MGAVLSKVDRDFEHFFRCASKVDYHGASSEILGRFLIAYHLDVDYEDQFQNREQREEFRQQLRRELKEMKVLDVGNDFSFTRHFGVSDYLDDLFGINQSIAKLRGEESPQLLPDYDLIVVKNSGVWPDYDSFQKAFITRWMKERGLPEDCNPFREPGDLNRILGQIESLRITARFYGLNEKVDENKVGGAELVTLRDLALEQVKVIWNGLVDLGRTNYPYQFIQQHLKSGGIFMDLDCRDKMIYDPFQLLDQRVEVVKTKWYEPKLSRTKVTFRKLTLQ